MGKVEPLVRPQPDLRHEVAELWPSLRGTACDTLIDVGGDTHVDHCGGPLYLAGLIAQLVVRPKRVEQYWIITIVRSHNPKHGHRAAGTNLKDRDPWRAGSRSHAWQLIGRGRSRRSRTRDAVLETGVRRC